MKFLGHFTIESLYPIAFTNFYATFSIPFSFCSTHSHYQLMSIKNPFIVNPLYTRVVLRWSSEVRGHPWWHFHQAKFGAYAPKLLDQNLGKYPDGVPFQFHLHFVAHMSLTQTNSPRNTPNVNQFYTQVIFGRSTPSEGSSMIMTFSQAKKGDPCTKFWIKKMSLRIFFFPRPKILIQKSTKFWCFWLQDFGLRETHKYFAKCPML